MSEPRTVASVYSSWLTGAPSPESSDPTDLLRTPVADEAGGGPLTPEQARERGQTLRLTGQILDHFGLLPTPAASLGEMGGGVSSASRRAGNHSVTLKDVVEHDITKGEAPTGGQRGADNPTREGGDGLTSAIDALLPTPLGSDGVHGGPNQRGGKGDLRISSVDVLFPTPGAALADGGQTSRSGARKDEPLLAGIAEELLPTPTTRNGDGSQTNNRGELLLPGVAEAMLPTPTAQDQAESGGSSPADVTPTDAVVRTDMGTRENPRHLLPTPSAGAHNDGEDAAQWQARADRLKATGVNGNGAGTPLPVAVQQAAADAGPEDPADNGEFVRWGKYRGAILRTQRALGRTAPPPTLPDGKGGKRRLAARFVEWMMMLTDGWVTGTPGITRRDQLKLLGNGVVPQQASAAALILLARIEDRINEREAHS